MSFVIAILIVALACVVLRNLIRTVPWLFYVLAVAVVVLYFVVPTNILPRVLNSALLFSIGRCHVPIAMFAVVMYIGLFPESSAARRWMQPVRGPLSIIACILTVGHMINYAVLFLPRMFTTSALSTSVFASLVISLVLFALILVLGITSFDFVKKAMTANTWKKIQRWAYLFYALAYAHLVLILLPAAVSGGMNAIENCIAYTVVFGVYAVARVVMAVRERAAERVLDSAAEGAEELDTDLAGA